METIIKKLNRLRLWPAFAAYVVWWAVCYFVPNHFNLLGIEPSRFDHWVDRQIPFLPPSVIVYLTVSGLTISGIIMVFRKERGRAMFAAMTLSVAHALLFVLFPTAIERSIQPEGIWSSLYDWLWLVDKPANCFPSMHVSGACLTALAVRRHWPRLGAVFLLWAAAIAVSTLTTKQHYAVDVVGGAAMATVVYYLVFVRPSSPSSRGRFLLNLGGLTSARFYDKVECRSFYKSSRTHSNSTKPREMEDAMTFSLKSLAFKVPHDPPYCRWGKLSSTEKRKEEVVVCEGRPEYCTLSHNGYIYDLLFVHFKCYIIGERRLLLLFAQKGADEKEIARAEWRGQVIVSVVCPAARNDSERGIATALAGKIAAATTGSMGVAAVANVEMGMVERELLVHMLGLEEGVAAQQPPV